MDIGERIKWYRKALGKSAEELADDINVSPSTIYRYENNDISNMGIDKLQAIATSLHVHAYDLMGWRNEPNQDSPKVLFVIEHLNKEGQKKVMDYAEDLLASGKYKNHSADSLPNNDSDKNADIEAEEIEKDFANMRALSED